MFPNHNNNKLDIFFSFVIIIELFIWIESFVGHFSVCVCVCLFVCCCFQISWMKTTTTTCMRYSLNLISYLFFLHNYIFVCLFWMKLNVLSICLNLVNEKKTSKINCLVRICMDYNNQTTQETIDLTLFLCFWRPSAIPVIIKNK